jgi:hypothetical protein
MKNNEGMRTVLARLKRTLLFGSKLGTIVVVMALGVGIGLGFSTIAHTPEAGNEDLQHACVNATTGQVLMPAGIQSPADSPCPSGWTAAHWPERVVVTNTPSETFSVPANGTAFHDIECADPNDRAISGGASALLLVNQDLILTRESFPLVENTWRVTVENTSGAAFDAVAHVICAPDG